MCIKKWSLFQYSLLPFRYEKGEGTTDRCSKPQSLDVGDCSVHYYIRILMFFGNNSRQTCTVIFAPRSCKP